MAKEKRERSIATRAVGKRCGFGDVVPFWEDVDGAGRYEVADAGVCMDVEVGCGINVVITVWTIAAD